MRFWHLAALPRALWAVSAFGGAFALDPLVRRGDAGPIIIRIGLISESYNFQSVYLPSRVHSEGTALSYFLALLLYGKNEQDDLSPAQRKLVAGLAAEMKRGT